MTSRPTYRYSTRHKQKATKAPKMSRMQVTDDDDEAYIGADHIEHDEDDNQFLDDFLGVDAVIAEPAISD